MSFYITAIGDEFSVRYPRAEHITPLNTAWALAQVNRFGGWAIRPYSLAEHSLLVCEIADRELHLDALGLFAALLHAAHKPYCGADMLTPMKCELGDPWYVWEHRWMRTVRNALCPADAYLRHGTAIRLAARMALATERRDLLPHATTPWQNLQGIEPVSWVALDDHARSGASWEHWRDSFLYRFHQLNQARQEQAFPVRQP